MGRFAGLAIALVMLVLPAAASADTFNVNAFLDTASDGLCDADCTLRDAVTTADGDDLVLLPPGTHTISLAGAPEDANASGDIDANSGDGPLLIRGTGAAPSAVIINATGLGARVFDLQGGADFEIRNLTITGGSGENGGAIRNAGPELTLVDVVLDGNTAPTEGGAVLNGTNLLVGSRMTIVDSVLSDNRVLDGDGGAIKNEFDGRVTVVGSVVMDNRAEGDSGDGGAIFSGDSGSLAVLSSRLQGNEAFADDSAGGGGAIRVNQESTGTVVDSVIHDNTSHNGGGGIYANNNTVLNVIETTVSNNDADEIAAEKGGGGIYAGNDSAVTILRSTVNGNSAAAIGGGGIARDFDGELDLISSTVSGNGTAANGGGLLFETTFGGRTTIVGSTIAGNSATVSGGGIFNDTDPGLVEPLTIEGTIVADNTAANCAAAAGATALVSGGFNLDSGSTCGFGPGGGDLENANPLLGPLADNGGPTLTRLPGLAGDAIDAGRANGLTVDQRGEPRTIDQTAIANAPGSDGTDIGAVELAFQNLRCDGRAVTIAGTPGADVISGTPRSDVIASLGGSDVVRARGGKDTVCGGAGNDRLFGQAGGDTLLGGGGRDRLLGGGGRDQLRGEGGSRDVCNGGPARDLRPLKGCERRRLI